MICSSCGADTVTWHGPLAALTHTECSRCGGINCQRIEGREEGDLCGRDGCPGHISIKPSENCSCHISPPCSSCTDAPLWCSACGWEDDDV